VRVRRVQRFFASAVLASYERRCALSDISVVGLLNASHIIPWRENAQRRADPCNGIALNVLYDRAFDRGLITFDPSLRVVVSERLKKGEVPELQRQALLELEGRELRRPCRFEPDEKALAWHRAYVFV
jgi:putative restriction endonuclease